MYLPGLVRAVALWSREGIRSLSTLRTVHLLVIEADGEPRVNQQPNVTEEDCTAFWRVLGASVTDWNLLIQTEPHLHTEHMLLSAMPGGAATAAQEIRITRYLHGFDEGETSDLPDEAWAGVLGFFPDSVAQNVTIRIICRLSTRNLMWRAAFSRLFWPSPATDTRVHPDVRWEVYADDMLHDNRFQKVLSFVLNILAAACSTQPGNPNLTALRSGTHLTLLSAAQREQIGPNTLHDPGQNWSDAKWKQTIDELVEGAAHTFFPDLWDQGTGNVHAKRVALIPHLRNVCLRGSTVL